MATSSLAKTFYIDSKKQAKNFVSMLADSVSAPSYNATTIKPKEISKERMFAIINKKLNEGCK
ncbi:MAG: hypothetical protein IK015_00005 [Treponema sp.]|nr:hypothetical protein [Treponema sp.]